MLDNKISLAVLVLALTMALMTGFQFRQILQEREQIATAFAQQNEPLGQVQNVAKQFESLAVGTARLAGEGHQAAQQILAGLRQIGISVNPNATPGSSAIQQIEPEAPAPNVNTPSAPATPPAAPAPANNRG